MHLYFLIYYVLLSNHDFYSKLLNVNLYLFLDELGLNKDRYKSLADEMDSTFAELAGY